MEQLGVLPSPEAVLNKLKSDGTFDQLRKSCQATIEGEVIFFFLVRPDSLINAASILLCPG